MPTGIAEANLYAAVRLTIRDRFCSSDVMEVPDDTPVLIGQLPLEQLDYVVDLRGRVPIGNPAHGGEQMYEFVLTGPAGGDLLSRAFPVSLVRFRRQRVERDDQQWLDGCRGVASVHDHNPPFA